MPNVYLKLLHPVKDNIKTYIQFEIFYITKHYTLELRFLNIISLIIFEVKNASNANNYWYYCYNLFGIAKNTLSCKYKTL